MNILSIIADRQREYPHTFDPRAVSPIVTKEIVKPDMLADVIKRDRTQFHSWFWTETATVLAITAETTVDLPGFRTPVWVECDKELYLVVDLRHCTKVDLTTRKLAYTDLAKRDYERVRCATMCIFVLKPDLMETYSAVNGKSFIRLFRDTIGRSLSLAPNEQDIVRGLVANFWLSSFEHDPRNDDENPRETEARLHRIARLANTTPDLYRLYHDGSAIPSAQELVALMKERINSPKMQHFSYDVMVNLISRLNAMDPTSAYNMAVGIDHPPTYIANVYSAISTGTRNAFGQIVKDTVTSNRDCRDSQTELLRLINANIN